MALPRFGQKKARRKGLAIRRSNEKELPSIKNALRSVTHGAAAIVPKIHLKTWTEDDTSDWWFAGTAVPLLAATIGPTANVLSIAALVTSWRVCLVSDVDPVTCPYNGNYTGLVSELEGTAYEDPRWAYDFNAASLALGFLGNIFLLFNFTGFVRYKIALPVTIIAWFIATGILIGITSAMHAYVPPTGPEQIFSQGFWYGVLAACLYLLAAVLLLLNMVGFFLGHFPERFNLSDSQRTLILQTMMFFIWLAAGGAIFSAVETKYGTQPEEWSYVNALYFADVTILTVGFGDIVCTSTLGRALVFPYSIGGIITLGLVISSISKFATEIGTDKIVRKHRERSRARTFERVVSTVEEVTSRMRRGSSANRSASRRNSSTRRASATHHLQISAPFDPVNMAEHMRIGGAPHSHPTEKAEEKEKPAKLPQRSSLLRFAAHTTKTLTPKPMRKETKRKKHKQRLLLLKEERDRFNTMRRLQLSTIRFQHWMSLFMSSLAFSLLWLLGALVFFFAEHRTQHLTYFEALYFCYVSLLTIGYGDFAPQSNVGRPFFVLWSLIAVPTMTILVSSMGNTVVDAFKVGTERIAEVTILPRMGVLRDVLNKWAFYRRSVDKIKADRERRMVIERLREGFEVGVDDEGYDVPIHPTLSHATTHKHDGEEELDLEVLAEQAADGKHPLVELQLARRLSLAMQSVAQDLRESPPKRYCYEEWVEFTQLIRFSNYKNSRREPRSRYHHSVDANAEHPDEDQKPKDDEPQELIEWDWIGANSPMMAKQTEPEFVMDRLCESMSRYLRQQAVRAEIRAKEAETDKAGRPVDGRAGGVVVDGITRRNNTDQDNGGDNNDDDDDDDGNVSPSGGNGQDDDETSSSSSEGDGEGGSDDEDGSEDPDQGSGGSDDAVTAVDSADSGTGSGIELAGIHTQDHA